MLALLLLVAAPHLTIEDVGEREGALAITVTVDFAADVPAAKARLAEALRRALGDTLRDFTYANFRFTNLRVAVEDVALGRSPSGGLTVVARAEVVADRARRRFAAFGPWDANGTKNLATLHAYGRITLKPAGKTVHVDVLADRVSVVVHLRPFSPRLDRDDLGGLRVHEVDVSLPGQLELQAIELRDVQTSKVRAVLYDRQP